MAVQEELKDFIDFILTVPLWCNERNFALIITQISGVQKLNLR